MSTPYTSSQDFDAEFHRLFRDCLAVKNNSNNSNGSQTQSSSIGAEDAMAHRLQDCIQLDQSSSSSPHTVAALQQAIAVSRTWRSFGDEGNIAKTAGSTDGQQQQHPELFSSRRAGAINTAMWASLYQSGRRPIRVIGFAQDIDTEPQLIQARPECFVQSIVNPAAAAQKQSAAQQKEEEEHLVECTSVFVTPIPGFEYLGSSSNGQQQQQQQQEQPASESSVSRSRRGHGDQKRQRLGEDDGDNAAGEDGDNGRVMSNNPQQQQHLAHPLTNQQKKQHREAEQQESVTTAAQALLQREQEQNRRQPLNNLSNGNSNSNKRATVQAASLKYFGDDDDAVAKRMDSAGERTTWRDVLGLSVAPTHESLATGTVAFFPHIGGAVNRTGSNDSNDEDDARQHHEGHHQGNNVQPSLPRLFETVEMIGFMISPDAADDNNNSSSNNQQQQPLLPAGFTDFGDDDEDCMASRIHRMPFGVAPRLLVVAWRTMPSVEAARESIDSKSNSNNIAIPRPLVVTPSNTLASEAAQFLTSNVFAGNSTAATVFLLHLVSSVTVRDPSGAFGDLPLQLWLPATANDTAFRHFALLLHAAVRALRPCAVLCEVDFGSVNFATGAATFNQQHNRRRPRLIPSATPLQLTHPTAVVARLDYSEQAVSSCPFSLPRGAEIILAADEQRVPVTVAGAHTPNSELGHYVRNIQALSDLLIQQKLSILYGPNCELPVQREIGVLLVVRKRSAQEERAAAELRRALSEANAAEAEAAAATSSLNLDPRTQRVQQHLMNTNSNNNGNNSRQLNGGNAQSVPAGGELERDIFIPLRCAVSSFERGSPRLLSSASGHREPSASSSTQGAREGSSDCAAGASSAAANDSTDSASLVGGMSTEMQNEIRAANEFEQEVHSRFFAWFQSCRDLYRASAPGGSGNRRCFESAEGETLFLRHVQELVPLCWSTAMIKHSVANTLLTMARARAALEGRAVVTTGDVDEMRRVLLAARMSCSVE